MALNASSTNIFGWILWWHVAEFKVMLRVAQRFGDVPISVEVSRVVQDCINFHIRNENDEVIVVVPIPLQKLEDLAAGELTNFVAEELMIALHSYLKEDEEDDE